MTFKEFFSFRKNRYFWLNIIVMFVFVVLLFWGALKWLDVYTRHGEAILVPDVKGMSVEQAEAQFEKCNLTYEVSDSTYVKELTPGCVLDYTPSAGMKVKKGRLVRMTINTLSVPLQEVPDVADNSSLRQAEARLLASGFKLDSVKYIEGEKDWVYNVIYKERILTMGDKIPMGAIVTLEVGDGGALANDSLNVDSLNISTQQPMAAPTENATEDAWF